MIKKSNTFFFVIGSISIFLFILFIAINFLKQREFEEHSYLNSLNDEIYRTERKIEKKIELVEQISNYICQTLQIKNFSEPELFQLSQNIINNNNFLSGILFAFDKDKVPNYEGYKNYYFYLQNDKLFSHKFEKNWKYYQAYWYQNFKIQKNNLWVEPRFDNFLKNPIINYVAKFNKPDNLFAGFIVLEINLYDLYRSIKNDNNNYQSYFLVLSSLNNIVFYKDTSLLTKHLSSIDDNFLIQVVDSNKNITDKDRFVLKSSLKNGWKIFYIVPQFRTTLVYKKLLSKYLLITIFGTLFIVLLFYILIRFFVKKYEKDIEKRVDEIDFELKLQNKELQYSEEVIKKQKDELVSLTKKIENEQHYLQRILENQSEGFMIFSQDGTITFANNSVLEILEKSKDLLIGSCLKSYIDEQVRESILKNICESSVKKFKFEIEHKIDTTKIKFLEINASLNKKENNEIEYLTFIRDITNEKIAHQKIEKQNKDLIKQRQQLEMTLSILEQNQEELLEDSIRMEMESAFAQILKLSVDANLKLNEFLQKMLEIVLKLPFLNVLGEKGSVFLTNRQGNLDLVAHKNNEAICDICSIVFPNYCICGKALVKKEIIFKKTLDEDHDVTYEGITDHGHYAIPFIFENNVLGLLLVYLEPNYEQKESEVNFLQNLSALVASLIHKNNLQEKIQEQSDLLMKQIIELKKFQTIINQSPVTITITDISHNIEYVNPCFTKISGYRFKEVFGRKHNFLFSKHTPNNIIEEMQKTLEQKSVWEGEFINERRDGSLFIEKAIIAPIVLNEQLTNFVAIKTDVTEQKQKDKEIKDLNRQLQNTINNLIVIYLRINLEGKVISCSNSLFAKTGYMSLNEINEYNILGSFPKSVINEIIKKGNLTNFEIKIKTKENKTLIGLANVSEWLDNEDRLAGAEGIITDITVEKELQDELMAANEQLEQNLLIIEKQKQIIAENHQNLLDNINYAKRIQESLIPSKEVLQWYFEKSFLFFLPKDIVSGDFYYLNIVENLKIIAVGDCTGHGVSGAFMTILSITFLQQAIAQYIIAPCDILENMRTQIKNIFKHFGNENPNSLEMIVCTIDQNNILNYAGANLPLFIVRNNELIEIKPTKCPIGFYYVESSFECKRIELNNSDLLYFFTDGYKDQLKKENETYEKFGIVRFRKLILEISSYSMIEQKRILRERLKNWQSKMKQIDDITILGIKIE